MGDMAGLAQDCSPLEDSNQLMYSYEVALHRPSMCRSAITASQTPTEPGPGKPNAFKQLEARGSKFLALAGTYNKYGNDAMLDHG